MVEGNEGHSGPPTRALNPAGRVGKSSWKRVSEMYSAEKEERGGPGPRALKA